MNHQSAEGDAAAAVSLAGESRFALGDLEVSPPTREVIGGGQRQILQPRTMQVLVALARQRGGVVARDALVATCWGGRIVSDDSLNRCILAIRQLASASGAFSITTVPRVGYRLDESPESVGRSEVAASRLSPVRTRLLGRDEELAELGLVLDRALQGHGSLVLLAGEPGVGKTRLAEEIAAKATRRGAMTLTGRCYETAGAPLYNPYNPFIEMVEEAARLLAAPTLRGALGADAAEVAKISPQLRKLFDDIPPPIELPSEQGRRYLFNAFRDFLERMARGRPLVLLFDDLHWADDATLGLLRHIVDRLHDMPVLILGTHRNAESDTAGRFADWWLDIHRRRLGQRLVLHPLGEKASVALIGALAGHGLPEALSASIYRTAEGNPFYIEEIVKHLMEEGRLQQAEDLPPLSELDVPDGVRAVVGKRLERLGPEAARVLSAAAIVGRQFSVELLEALGMNADLVLNILDEAQAALIVVADPAGYRFAHELIRQSLIAGISPTRRQRLHLQVAEAIERISGVDPEAHAADIGHHLAAAGSAADPAKTSRYLLMAGDIAYSRGAFDEASLAYRQALAMLATQAESPEREARELELWSALNRVLQLTSGYAASDTLEAAARARALARKTGSLSKLIREEARVWRGVITAGDYAGAATLADHILDLAQGDEPHPGRLVFAYNAQVQTRFYTGDLRGVEENFEHLSPLIDAEGQRQAPGNNNVAIGVASLNAGLLGRPDVAHQRMARAFALAESSHNPYDLAMALHFQGILSSLEGDALRAEEVAEQLVTLSEQNGFSYALNLARSTLGWARARRGQVDEGLSLLRRSWWDLEASGARVGITYVLSQLAVIEAEGATLQEAFVSIEKALTAHPQERVFRPETLRRRGDLQLRIPDARRAEADFREALALARAMGAKAWESLASASLARLQLQGDPTSV